MFNGTEIGLLITTIRDLFQIIFFGVVFTITILSYLQAKKTLFTPIKTEIFKMQIKAFEEILIFFQNKSESDYAEQFDFDEIVNINCQYLFLDYIEHFFKNEISIDKEKVAVLKENTVGAIVSESYMSKHFMKLSYCDNLDKVEQEEITNPALILKSWQEYEYGKIGFTKKYEDEVEKLENLSASPLLPQPLKEKLNTFNRKVSENLSLVGKVLNEVAQELPTRFPNSNALKKYNQAGIWNTYNNEMKSLKNEADDILLYIREYLHIDTLIK
jgi:glutamyl/glutaminyl-tRNA synthetase